MVLTALPLLLAAATAPAHAGPDATRDALDRLDEILALRLEDGQIAKAEVVPAIVVSAAPHWQESTGWYGVRALEVLDRAFGAGNLRLCEACTATRTFVGDGNMVLQAGPIGLDEVARLDDLHRGGAPAAKSAIWLDEHRGGVSIRIVDLGTGRVVFAQNVDPFLVEHQNTARMYSLAEEYERRARGGSLTQAFVDLSLYPGQHIALDWTEQWGKTNANLTGVTLTILDPIAGLGAVHYRRFDFFDVLLGAKVVVSVPTALVRLFQDTDVVDPLLTLVGVARVPFGKSNYGAVVTVSTNGTVGVGVSLLNISLLPVLP